MGPGRLTRLEIRLWEQDEMIVMQPWERRAVLALDAAWLASVAEGQAAQTKPRG